MMVRVKICGLTNADDALAAASAGADALGFVLCESPRRISPVEARDIIRRLPPHVATVGVFANDTVERILAARETCGFDAVQLHGDEDDGFIAAVGGRVVKAVKVKPDRMVDVDAFGSAILLLDTYDPGRTGGTGRAFDWSMAVEAAGKRPVVLAGGLNPDNVAEAVKQVRPWAVDVSGGVEREKGKKDHAKLEAFIRMAGSV